MSLRTQLWLTVLAILLLALGGALLITQLSARNYLEEQLYIKNSDNAASLALTLSQPDMDPVSRELLLAAQFDTGFYRLIRLTSPQGNDIIVKQRQDSSTRAPLWFRHLLPIEVPPGKAQVQQGWKQAGTLEVQTHDRFAYDDLWQGAKRLLLLHMAILAIAALLVHGLLRVILRPLLAAESQARAIADKRFPTITPPRTPELRSLVEAMNHMSRRVHGFIEHEAARLDRLQQAEKFDPVSRLYAREHVLNHLDALLHREDANATGVLTLVRIPQLEELNRKHGRGTMDKVIAAFGSTLEKLARQCPMGVAGRLNGSEFLLICCQSVDAGKTGREVRQALLRTLESLGQADAVHPAGAACRFGSNDRPQDLLAALDNALADREPGDAMPFAVTDAGSFLSHSLSAEELAHWRDVLERALAEDQFSLAAFPVTDFHGELIHWETPVRLHHQNRELTAGEFLVWIERLGLSAALDQRVLSLALSRIEREQSDTCINLSEAGLAGGHFTAALRELLENAPGAAKRLWLDVDAQIAFRNPDRFRDFCAQAREFGCRVGIQHFGPRLTLIAQLHDTGFHYVKFDATLARDIDGNPAGQRLLQSAAVACHALDLLVIAGGVESQGELETLLELGLDGATGPAVTLQK